MLVSFIFFYAGQVWSLRNENGIKIEQKEHKMQNSEKADSCCDVIETEF